MCSQRTHRRTGPLAIAVLRLILPYDTNDDAAAIATKVAAAPAVEGVVLWLTYLALLTLPLGVLIAGRQAMRARPAPGRPRLGTDRGGIRDGRHRLGEG